MRDRILIGDVAEPHVPERSFDLVICREVLEHLTVVQVRQDGRAALPRLLAASST